MKLFVHEIDNYEEVRYVSLWVIYKGVVAKLKQGIKK